MSKLVGTILETTISQGFNLTLEERQSIGGIRPHIMSIGDPSGTFKFSIKESSTTLVEKEFTVSDIKSDLDTTKSRIHIYKGLIFDTVTELKGGSYSLELSSTDYTPTTSSYMAWISDWDNFYFNINGTVSSDFNYPYSFELWSFNRKTFI